MSSCLLLIHSFIYFFYLFYSSFFNFLAVDIGFTCVRIKTVPLFPQSQDSSKIPLSMWSKVVQVQELSLNHLVMGIWHPGVRSFQWASCGFGQGFLSPYTNPSRRSSQSCWDSGPHTCESQFLITLCPGVVMVLGRSDLLMTCGSNSFLGVTQLFSQERGNKKWRWTPIYLPIKDTSGTNVYPWSQWQEEVVQELSIIHNLHVISCTADITAGAAPRVRMIISCPGLQLHLLLGLITKKLKMEALGVAINGQQLSAVIEPGLNA